MSLAQLLHISPCRQYFLSIVQSFFAAFGTYKFLCSFYSSTTPPPPLSMNAAGPSEKCSKLLYYRHILKRNPKVPKPLFLLANSILISFQKHCELKVQAFSENPVVGALLVVKLLQQLFRSLRALQVALFWTHKTGSGQTKVIRKMDVVLLKNTHLFSFSTLLYLIFMQG